MTTKLKFTDTCEMEEYCQVLKREGFVYEGSGCFGTVYSKGDIAVKFGPYNSNTAYLDYVREVTKAKEESPWLPRIDAFYDCRSKNGYRWFVVQLERLEDGEDSDDFDTHYDTVRELEAAALSTVCRYGSAAYIRKLRNELESKQKGTKPLLRMLKKLLNKHTQDLHTGNVMRRKNGEFVVTDPVC